jgi:recombination protein RecT
MANEIVLINPKTIGAELEKFVPQMERALPRHISADRMARIALTALRVNPKLMNCTRDSFYGSLMAASQLGLEPGINGQCYLIPYGTTCTLVPGWRGYMDLLNRTERASAWTEAVYDGDEFEYSLGTNPDIHHKRGKWAGKEAALSFVYAVGRIKNSDFPIIDVWDIDKIWAHRNKQNKVGDRHYSFVHPEMYARKIPLLQVLKYLPSSIELSNASALDASATEGHQSLTIDMALKGELENGGAIDTPSPTDPIEQELDELFAKLGTNPAMQVEMRKGYAGRPKELVDYLKGKLAPIQVTPVATQVQTQPDPAAGQDNSATGEVKRGRGRPRKEQPTLLPAADVAKDVGIPANQAQAVAPQDETEHNQEDTEQGSYEENPNLPDTAASAFNLI